MDRSIVPEHYPPAAVVAGGGKSPSSSGRGFFRAVGALAELFKVAKSAAARDHQGPCRARFLSAIVATTPRATPGAFTIDWSANSGPISCSWTWIQFPCGVWTQQGSKLVGTGVVGNQANQGSVALSGDGNTAIVGGNADNGGTGAAWVFTRSAGVWAQQGDKLVGAGGVG
jgi:hypothetical protein